MEHKNWKIARDKLNGVGCGMCAAKWTQVTIHLQTGRTHSCHHPGTHTIPLDEIRNNPSALHNTKYKKEQRKKMLNGERPEECGYCWNVEDNSDRISDRILKSADFWSLPHLDDIIESPWDADWNPQYVEVAWSNACNFKCSYCAPQFSTPWLEEIKKHGPYPTSMKFNDLDYIKREGQYPIPPQAPNPYVDAFWKWWPDLYKDLKVFRMTGGEPLLAKDTWDVLDFVIDTPDVNRNLGLSVNSNLGVNDRLIDKFIEKINRIEDGNRVKEFVLYTSVDTWGPQAEYIRNGLEFNRFWDNVNKILEKCPKITLTFMVTYNALSVPNFDKLIEGVYGLKQNYTSSDRYWPPAVTFDVSYLRHPTHQTVQILPEDPWAEKILNHAGLMDFYCEKPAIRHGHALWPAEHNGYFEHEVQKVHRIYDWMKSDKDLKRLAVDRNDFHKFITEHDKRRGTDFAKTFPELVDFYHACGEKNYKRR